jgi:hypothetical protein
MLSSGMTPCGSCKNWRFRGMYHLRHQGGKNKRARNKISKELVLTRVTWCHIPEDGVLHSHCHENLKSYMYDANLTVRLLIWNHLNCTLLEGISLDWGFTLYKSTHFLLAETLHGQNLHSPIHRSCELLQFLIIYSNEYQEARASFARLYRST